MTPRLTQAAPKMYAGNGEYVVMLAGIVTWGVGVGPWMYPGSAEDVLERSFHASPSDCLGRNLSCSQARSVAGYALSPSKRVVRGAESEDGVLMSADVLKAWSRHE